MYIETVKKENKKIVVFGLGMSGKAAIKFLIENEVNTLVWDDNVKGMMDITKQYDGNKFFKVEDYEKYNWSEIACIVLSAGIPLTHPKPHHIVDLAKANNCPIICDVELLYKCYPNNNYIGITGTNGKSTTTALLGHIFDNAKLDYDMGGNLGNKAALDLTKFQNDAYYIIEMSSYMIDLIYDTKFKTAILTNITPDHIDRHGSFDNYIEVKKKIFMNMNSECYAIICIDNENSKRVYEELKKDITFKGNLLPVSVKKILKDGISFIDGEIFDYYDGNNKTIVVGDLKYLKGEHNAENIICAFACAKINGIPENDVIEYIKSFKGLAHRMQFVKTVGNITFINDSKATNAESTEQALKANNDIYWILGGRQKEGGIKSLSKYFNKIKKAFLIGEATEEFAKTLDEESDIQYYKCDDLETAFNKAYDMAKEEPKEEKITILLSPACASWDQWKNFEERGNFFIQKVNEIKEE